jgi:hypothetical protein
MIKVMPNGGKLSFFVRLSNQEGVAPSTYALRQFLLGISD